MRPIQNLIWGILMLTALPMAFLNGISLFNSFVKPQLVYSVDSARVPVSFGGKTVNYFAKTIYFENLGKNANHLRVELTLPPIQLFSAGACTDNQLAQNVILQEGAKQGELLMRSSDITSSEWGEAFQGELESYSSLIDFKNKKREGPAIIRKDNETIMVAYKDHFYGSQRGYLKLTAFGQEPEFSKMVFESDEVIGKEKKNLTLIERLMTSRIFLTLLSVLIVVNLILESVQKYREKTDRENRQ